jgi:hypothetical protein
VTSIATTWIKVSLTTGSTTGCIWVLSQWTLPSASSTRISFSHDPPPPSSTEGIAE